MRVLFVTSTFPDFVGSPRGTFISGLAEALVERGLEVAVVTPQMLKESSTYETWAGGIPVTRFAFGTEGRQLATYEQVPKALMMRYLTNGLKVTQRAITAWHPDLIHGHWIIPTGLIAAWAGSKARKPVVLSAHGSDVLVWANKGGIFRRLCQWTLRRSRQCSVNSQPMQDAVAQLGMSANFAPIIYELGVDAQRFHPRNDGSAWRSSMGAARDDLVVLSVGHLVARKGADILLQAAAHIAPDTPCLRIAIAGDGPERARLERLARDEGIADRTTFLGAVRHASVHELYAGCDIFALTSRSEGMGIVLLEAMASGKPVVATRVDGIPDIVQDEATGLLASNEDVFSLARQLARLCADPDLRRHLGLRGRAVIEERFLPGQQIERVIAMYEAVLA